MYDMRYSFISQEDLENNVSLYGFFNSNYIQATSQNQGKLTVYAEYRYGSSLKVSVQDSVRIAKIVDDQYTTYAKGSNVPLDLKFDNIYTVIQNTSDYSKLIIDTSMREKAYAFVGQEYWNTSFWDGTLYAPTQVTDTRQAIQ
jgi:hypothetical protein